MAKTRWRRRLAAFLGVLAVIVVGAWLLGEAFKTRDYVPYFQHRRSDLASVSETVLDETAGYSVVHVALRSELGIEVEGHVRAPISRTRSHPALVLP